MADNVDFLLRELSRWRENNWIDDATHQLLVRQYSADALESELESRAAHQLELELDHRDATALQQAQLVSELAVPVEQRADRLASAAERAIADVASFDVTGDTPAADVEQRILQEESRWPRLLKPLLSEHALWLSGGLLVLFGSLYFLRLVFERLSNLWLYAGAAGALLGYAAAFFAVGYFLASKKHAHATGRALHGFALALTPLSSVALGEAVALPIREHSAPGLAGSLVLTLAALVAAAFMLAVIGGVFERSSSRPLVVSGTLLSVLTISIGPLSCLGAGSGARYFILLLGLGVTCHGLWNVATRVRWRGAVFAVAGALLWSFAALLVRGAITLRLPLGHYAPLAGALAFTLIACDGELRRRAGRDPRVSAILVGGVGVALFGLLLSLRGLVTVGYFDLGVRLSVLGSACCLLLAAGYAAKNHGRRAFTWLCAGSGLLVYFFLPALFRGLLQQLQSVAGQALGYENAALPVAYYGLTFLPYVLLLTGAAHWLGRRRPDLARDVQLFLYALVLLLCGLSLTSRDDLRPLLFCWPSYAALALLFARLFAQRWLWAAFYLLVAGTLTALGLELLRSGVLVSPSVLSAGFAVACSFTLLIRRPPPYAAFGALLACATSLICLVVPETPGPQLVFGLAGCSLCLTLSGWQLRSAIPVLLAVLSTLGAALATCLHYQLSLMACYGLCTALALLGLAGAAAALKRSLTAQRVLGGPALLLASSSLCTSFALGVLEDSAWLPLAAALLLCVAALLSRGLLLSLIGSLLLAIAAALGSEAAFPGHWPLTLSALAALQLFISAALRERRQFGERKAAALATASVLVAAVAFWACVLRALPGMQAASWWGFAAMAGAAVYVSLAVRVFRSSHPALATWLLGCLALGTTSAAIFLVEALISLPIEARVWLHAVSVAAVGAAYGLGSRLFASGELRAGSAGIGLLLTLPALFAALGAALFELAAGQAATSLPNVHPLALAAAAACAVAVRLNPRSASARGHWLRWLTLLAVWLLAVDVVFGRAMLSWSLSAAGLALFAARARGRRLLGRELLRAQVLIPLGLAVLASPLTLGNPALAVASVALTLVLALEWRSTPSSCPRAHALGSEFAVGFVASSALCSLWCATRFDAALHASVLVLAATLPAAARALAAIRGAALGRGVRGLRSVELGAYFVAGPTAAAAAWLAAPGSVSAIAACGLGVAIFWRTLYVAHREASRALWFALPLQAPLLFVTARACTQLGSIGPWFDASVALLASHAALWLSTVRAERLNARPLRAAAIGWPLLSPFALLELQPAGTSLSLLLLAVHYSLAARLWKQRRVSVLAMLFGNAGLFVSWHALGLTDLLAYWIPVSLSLLTLIHVYAAELSPRTRGVLRSLILSLLYVLSVGKALIAVSPSQTLLLVPSLCVAAIFAGSVLRVRAYLLLGTVFLAVDLVLSMLRYGLQDKLLGALFLTLLGLLIVGSLVVFSLQRERLLRHYSSFLGELRGWE